MTDVVHPGSRARRAPGEAHRLLPTPTSRAAALALAMVSVLHLVAQIGGDEASARATQAALMPLLAAVLWCATSAPRSRLVRLVLIALGFSWLGDALPGLVGDGAAFAVMMGSFIVAQLVYVAAFWPDRGRSVARRPGVLALYAGSALVLVGLCVPGTPGGLLAAVVGYAVCIVVMAVLATGVHPLAAAGGVVFLASDAMIALGMFTPWLDPGDTGFWVMLTYVAGQSLLVAGVLARRP